MAVDKKSRALCWWIIILGLALFWGAITYVLWPATADANPFLVCDPPTTGGEVGWYELTGLDYLDPAAQYPPETDGSLKVDMVVTPTGIEYTVRAKACNVWGCSVLSDPFIFTRMVVVPPSGVDIVP